MKFIEKNSNKNDANKNYFTYDKDNQNSSTKNTQIASNTNKAADDDEADQYPTRLSSKANRVILIKFYKNKQLHIFINLNSIQFFTESYIWSTRRS